MGACVSDASACTPPQANLPAAAHGGPKDFNAERSAPSPAPVQWVSEATATTAREGLGTWSSASAESSISRAARDRMIGELVQWNRVERKYRKQLRTFLHVHGFHGVNVRRHRLFGTRFWYPLHCAVHKGDASLVWLLLRAGADPQLRDSSGRTPYEYATAATGCSSHPQVLAVLGAQKNGTLDLDSHGAPHHWLEFFGQLGDPSVTPHH